MLTSKKWTLQRILRNHLALSTVVTSLIILVISVLLAGVVTYFAVNVTGTRSNEESLALTKQHCWFDSSADKSQAAIMVINSGGRDVMVEKLTVRGQACDWSKVFYYLSGDAITGDLPYSAKLEDGCSISVGGSSKATKQATTHLTIESGKTLVIYLDNPDSISANDVGLTVSITVFTAQAMYHKETNVQGAVTVKPTPTPTATPTPTEAPKVEAVTLSGMQAWYNTGTDQAEVALVIQNTGTLDVDISDISYSNAWGKDYFYTGTFTLSSPLQYIPNLADGSPTVLGVDKTLTLMINDFPQGCIIKPGQSMILYVKSAIGITSDDIGKPFQGSITMTSNNVYTQTATVASVT